MYLRNTEGNMSLGKFSYFLQRGLLFFLLSCMHGERGYDIEEFFFISKVFASAGRRVRKIDAKKIDSGQWIDFRDYFVK